MPFLSIAKHICGEFCTCNGSEMYPYQNWFRKQNVTCLGWSSEVRYEIRSIQLIPLRCLSMVFSRFSSPQLETSDLCQTRMIESCFYTVEKLIIMLVSRPTWLTSFCMALLKAGNKGHKYDWDVIGQQHYKLIPNGLSVSTDNMVIDGPAVSMYKYVSYAWRSAWRYH